MRFDAQTLAAFGLASTPTAKAEAIRDSLGSGTLTVTVKNGETTHLTGTFSGPLTASEGTLSADVVLTGTVATSGTPNASTWTCRIANASGKHIEDAFGPGGRFTWNATSMVAGQKVRLYISMGPAPGYPAWRQGLTPWQWYEIANTALSSIAPSPTPPGITGPVSKVDAWCGGTLRRAGSVYMLGAAGGHGDYAGNEVNAITLSADVPAWQQVKAPSALADIIKDSSVYLDLTRAAIHTYSNTQYDQIGDRMLIVAGAGIDGTWGDLITPTPDDWPWRTGSHSSPPDPVLHPLMAFSWSTKGWLPPDTLGLLPAGVGGTGALACADPVANLIYSAAVGWGGLKRYSPATDTWTPAATIGYISTHAGAVDTIRNRMLIIGPNVDAPPPRLVDLAAGELMSVTWSGLAESTLQAAHPGLVYDEHNDRYVAAINGSGPTDPVEIYFIDPQTHVISQPEIAGTKPLQRPNGIHNAMQYAPELKGIVLHNSYTGNVKFLPVA